MAPGRSVGVKLEIMRLRALSGVMAFALTCGSALAADPAASGIVAPASKTAVDLSGAPRDPFSSSAKARVFLFLRTDCPIGNRYAPELQRLAKEFANQKVDFWLVYPDADETAVSIQNHIAQYHFPGEALHDAGFALTKRAHATVAPEAAVFDQSGKLLYHGRIDDRWIELGQGRPAAKTHDLEDAIAAVIAGKPVAQPETHAVGCYLTDLQ